MKTLQSGFRSAGVLAKTLLLLGLLLGSHLMASSAQAAQVPTVSIAASDASAAESGTPPANTGTFTVSRGMGGKGSDGDATVTFNITGAAGNGTDYRLRLPTGAYVPNGATTGTVVITNTTSVAIVVEPLEDAFPEESEPVTLTLTSVSVPGMNYQLGGQTNATVTIADNDTTISISASDASASEAGPDTGVFTITRRDGLGNPVMPGFPVTVNYTISGTAGNGSDYNSIGTSVIIAASSSSATVTVTPINDATDELTETVILTLAAGTYNIAGSPSNTATVSIADNDGPAISINDVSVTEGDSGITNAIFSVTLSAASPQIITVNYATTNGTASAGTDYLATSGTLTFPANSTAPQTIAIAVNGDLTGETNETFFVNLSSPVNATLADSQGQGTILSDDPITSGCPSLSFIMQGPFASGVLPVSVAVGDFNGDGKRDLVTANKFSYNVSVLLGKGDGTFHGATNYPVGPTPTAVATGDINGDGKLDLAVTDSELGSVLVLLGNGNGTFQSPVEYAVGMRPQAVVMNDFDNDGQLDLAVANRTDGTISVLLRNPNGSFKMPVNYDAGADAYAIVVGFFNSGTVPDLAVANAAIFDVPPSVSVLLGGSGGTFGNTVYYTNAPGTSPRSLALGDFNGDNRPDLAVANTGSGTNNGVAVLLGNANGTFQPASTNYPAGAGSLAVVTADFNADTKLDLAVANNAAGTVSVLVGNGNGTFKAPFNYPAGTEPAALAAADFNGDGRPDLAIANSGGVLIMLRIDVPLTLNGLPSLTLNVQCLDDVPPPATVTACNGDIPVTYTSSESGDDCNHVILRTWSATDIGGNMVSFTQTITVHDDTPPILSTGTISSNYLTVAAAQAAALAATGTSDNCSAVTKTVSTVGTCDAVITVTGTDACGNHASVIYNTRIDNTPPVLVGLPPATLNLQCPADVPAPATVTAMDNCDTNVMVAFVSSQSGTACNMTITRTWSAMDMSGNAISFTQTITVHDTTAPTLTKGTIASSYQTLAAAEAAALAATSASDNCSTVTNTVSTVGTCAATITVTGTDACGNQRSVTYNTRIDGTPPVLSGLPSATVNVQCPANVPAPPAVTATDNCDTTVQVTLTTNQTGTPCDMTITRTWSATDTSGNNTSFTQTITVHNDTPLTLTKGSIAAGYQTVAEAQAAALAATTASDGCNVTKTASTVGTCSAVVTVTGTDACGNQQTVNYTTSINNTAPVLAGLPAAGVSVQCLADVPAAPTVTATDDCQGALPVTYTTNQTGTACNLTITRTWSAVDISGNTASFTQTINVHDDTSPILVKGSIAPGYQNAADAEADAIAATSASDNCSTVTMTAVTVGDCGMNPAVVTVTGTDACGNQQSVAYTTSVNNIPPNLIGLPPATVNVQCLVDVPAAPTVTAVDDCDGPRPVTYTTNQTGTACNLTITRTWSAQDMAGNMSSFTQTITVHDDTAPILTKGTIAAGYKTVAAAETAALAATSATDNCSAVTKTVSTVGTCNAVVTVTGTDACGNQQSVSYNTRVDNTPPMLVGLPAGTLNVQCAGDVPAPATVTATDNCDANVPVTLATNQTGTACNLTITRTWSAIDISSNTVSFTQTITVHDTTPPVLTKGTIAASYQTAAAAETAALAATSATDNCTAVTKTVATVGTCNAVITVTGTDACGNQQSVTYNTRIDNTPPVLSGLPPATLTVQCPADVPAPATVTANDNCAGSVPVTLTTNQTGTACNLTITRSWSAMDTSGNTVSFTQTITVHDTTAPVLTKGTIAASYQTETAAETAALAATTATDNCSAVTKTANTVGTCTATITVTGTDACGNQQSVTYNTRIDNTPPVLSGLPAATLTVQCAADVPAAPTVTALDNCAGAVAVTLTTNQTGTACNRTITRTWSAADTSGNTATFTQTITVHDTTPPVLTKGSIAASYQTLTAAETAALAATGASDNCSAVTKTASTSGTCAATITVTGSDACGNQQSVTYNTRIDAAPPVLSGLPPVALTVQCPADVPAPPTVTATDNCDGAVAVTFATNQTGTACSLTIRRTWSATDTSGNTVSFVQTITVQDTTAPTLTKGTIAASYPTVSAAESAALAATTASDNCSAVTKTAATVGTCNAVVTVTGADACGNQQSVTYNTRIDSAPPALTGLPAATLNVQCPADVPALPTVTATDNCDGILSVTLTTNQTGTACNLTLTRTWSATDNSGNGTNFTQTITVHDTNAPTLTKGTIAASYQTAAAAEAAALAATTAADNCSAVTKTVGTVGTCDAVVTVTGTDACGNQQSVSYSTRIDNTPPVLNGLPAGTLAVQCPADVPAPPAVTATDNCAGTVPVVLATNQTGTACNLTLTRTWSATDTSSNTVSFTQTITIHDTNAPTLTKGTIAASYQTVPAAEAAALAATAASDNCSAVTKTVGTVGTCDAVVTVTGTDACGNQQSVSYNTRIDNTPPVLSGLPVATLAVQCPADVPAPPAVTATDDCAGTVPVVLATNQTGTACNLTLTRTWSATDTASNTASFTQTITIRDTNAPTLTKGTIATNYQSVAEAEAAALAATTATDNCSAVTKTANTSGACPATITVTGTDGCGNQQNVTYTTCISSAVSLAIRRTAGSIIISWPMPSTGFVLESTTSLSAPNWQTASEVPVANNGRWEVTATIAPGQRYFRLHKP